MRRVVLDTNVLVSGLLHPGRVCARLLDLVVDGHIETCLDERILAEYRDVLSREKLGIPSDKADVLLGFLRQTAAPIVAPPLAVALPDPDDLCFLEVAAAGDADLVTGNPRHFPKALAGPVTVLSPAQYLERLRERPQPTAERPHLRRPSPIGT